MIQRTCDRCGGSIPGAVNYGWVAFGDAAVSTPDDRQDLCLACLKLLREWMRPVAIIETLPPSITPEAAALFMRLKERHVEEEP